MIEVEHLTKHYGTVPAVDDISFRVEKGEILGFLGPNAAGKTTTMRMLTGFLPATAGKAKVAGFDVARDSLEVRRRVGYLPETVPLYHEMEVSSYLGFVAEVKGVAGGRRRQAVGAVVEQCGLGHVLRKRIGNLSKGFRQRVGVAQALLNDPEVLILDEPTIGLDPQQILDIRQLVRSLAGERTIILSTHILPEVSMTCQRVIIINRGRLVAEGTPAHLTEQLQKTGQVLLQVAAAPQEVTARIEKLTGVLEVKPAIAEPEAVADVARLVVSFAPENDIRGELAREVTGAGWDLQELRPLVMSLEDIFMRVVAGEEDLLPKVPSSGEGVAA